MSHTKQEDSAVRQAHKGIGHAGWHAMTRTKMSGYQSSTSGGTGQECMVKSLNEESRSNSMGGLRSGRQELYTWGKNKK